MKSITVDASYRYEVMISSGLLARIGNFALGLGKTGTVAVISDSNVWPIYGDTVCKSLHDSGLASCHYVFPAGEQSKTAETYLKILNFLACHHLTRSDLIIALGGGVTGDLAGFAAATYLRGIAYIQVPTSLLAMVDSSVGGKTAIDLHAGKNLAGAFYQPKLVLCDTDVLQTLPSDVFRDGCAEVIKYGILYDRDLFGHLATNGLAFDRETVISRCVELKRDVVAADEFDTGARQMLNLGHTAGHAVEALSQYSLSHGKCVAIGMAIVARACCAHGYCSAETTATILQILDTFGLPDHTAYKPAEIFDAALSDKKRFGATINLVLPQQIGICKLQKLPIDRLQTFIEAGVL